MCMCSLQSWAMVLGKGAVVSMEHPAQGWADLVWAVACPHRDHAASDCYTVVVNEQGQL